VQAIMPSSLPLDLVILLIGLAVGNCLNMVALRALSEQSLTNPRSFCSYCHHQLGPYELIPIVSYVMQKGCCTYCGKRLAWYYPFVEVITAVFFLVLVHSFGITWYTLGMLVFASTLIAITITDFKEKLIPHEITYPSIIAGIIFSTVIRQDTLGTLAGIGISYILFDFLAFYGLQFYLLKHTPELTIGKNRAAALEIAPLSFQPEKTLSKKEKTFLSRSITPQKLQLVSERIRGSMQMIANGQPVHEIEVMGGGDAVLAALISAWLGLPRLIWALLIGFLIGAFLGAAYLLVEMHKERVLSKVILPLTLGSICGCGLMLMFLSVLGSLSHQPYETMPWLGFVLVGSAGGALLGVILSGSVISKPFPFGPALAGGAVAAIFINPGGNGLGVGR